MATLPLDPMKALAPSAAASPARKKILVVDDDSAIRTGLDHLLVGKGYEVLTAVNGIQALALLRREPCDLALLDINMPLLNGWGTIGELRRLHRALPILIMTARPDQQTLAREAGVELMEKPLDFPLLLLRVEALLLAAHVPASAQRATTPA